MKIGDKLYCIKNHIHNKNVLHKVNHQYTILNIFTDGEISVSSELKVDISYKLYNDEITVWSNYYCFDDLLSNYFLTQQEYRKLKLEKINSQTR